MSHMPRPIWSATIAKLVSPLEPERAAKAIAGLVAVLDFPDEAFTMASAQAVCSTGRVLEAGVYGPLTRVPTFGELQTALGRSWNQSRRMQSVRAAPVARERLPAPETDVRGPTPEVVAEVGALVKAFTAERSFRHTGTGISANPRAESKYLSDGQLLAEYERLASEGVTIFQPLIAMLRKKIKAAAMAARQSDEVRQ